MSTPRTYTRAGGADLPEYVDVEHVTGRHHAWHCRRCDMLQTCLTKTSAFERAWEHVVGHYACELLNEDVRTKETR